MLTSSTSSPTLPVEGDFKVGVLSCGGNSGGSSGCSVDVDDGPTQVAAVPVDARLALDPLLLDPRLASPSVLPI